MNPLDKNLYWKLQIAHEEITKQDNAEPSFTVPVGKWIKNS